MTKIAETNMMRRARIQAEALALVRDGYSFTQAGEKVGVGYRAVANWAKQIDLKSPAGTRWTDFSHRAPLAKTIRASGGTWEDVAAAWSAAEGFVGSGSNAYAWTTKNAPEIVAAGKGKRPEHVRRAIISAYSAGASA